MWKLHILQTQIPAGYFVVRDFCSDLLVFMWLGFKIQIGDKLKKTAVLHYLYSMIKYFYPNGSGLIQEANEKLMLHIHFECFHGYENYIYCSNTIPEIYTIISIKLFWWLVMAIYVVFLTPTFIILRELIKLNKAMFWWSVLDEIMALDQNLLKVILENHILKLRVTLNDLYNGQLLETLGGKLLRVFVYRTVSAFMTVLKNVKERKKEASLYH